MNGMLCLQFAKLVVWAWLFLLSCCWFHCHSLNVALEQMQINSVKKKLPFELGFMSLIHVCEASGGYL